MRHFRRALLLCLLLGFDSTLHAAAVPMSVRGMDIQFPLFSVFMLPGEELSIAVDRAHSGELLVDPRRPTLPRGTRGVSPG